MFMIILENYAGDTQKSDKIMKMQTFATQDPDAEYMKF
jgi:hypothetical protein